MDDRVQEILDEHAKQLLELIKQLKAQNDRLNAQSEALTLQNARLEDYNNQLSSLNREASARADYLGKKNRTLSLVIVLGSSAVSGR